MERVTYDEDNRLDEVVTCGGAHLEAMDGDAIGGTMWFLDMRRADGSSVALWIDGRVTKIEERGPGKWWLTHRRPCPSCSGTGEITNSDDN